MTTWLDRLRAEGQGRTTSQSFTAPDGSHVFILGAEGQPEPAILSGGDFTEVKQLVDLTEWDLVAATMHTVGAVMGQAQPAPGFPDDYPPLWHFNYNLGTPTARNLVTGGFDVDNQGNMAVGDETYSPALTRCRQVPIAGTGFCLGQNLPQWFAPSPLDTYTFQKWLNFDSDAHPSSWGINPLLFHCVDAVPNGIEFGLAGTFGPGHQWTFTTGHHFGGSTVNVFPAYVIDVSPGWHLYTIVWDRWVAPWDRLLLYVDDNPFPVLPFNIMGNSPLAPAPATPIQIADPLLWGQFDEERMLNVALTVPEIATSYAACTSWPTPIDYEWLMQIIINNEIYGERVVRPDEERDWTDFKAPVRHLVGENEVAFRLTLQEI